MFRTSLFLMFFGVALIACQSKTATDTSSAENSTDTHAQIESEDIHAAQVKAVSPTMPADVHTTHRIEIALAPPPAKPWTTDAPLREGMNGIAVAVAKAQAAQEAGTFSPEQANGLANTVNERFGFMISNCKLEPEEDAALHGLLAQLIAGTQQLRSDPGSIDAMSQLQKLLNLYPHYFDHPGWSAGSSGG